MIVLLAASLGLAQDFTGLQVDRVATGFHFTEGPVWSPDGYLLFSDTVGNRIHKYIPGQGTSVFREDPAGANGNALDSQGRLYTCQFRERRVVRIDKKGKVTVLADRFEGKRLNAPNDIVVRRDGHAWFTDPAFGFQQDTRELDFYGVYHLTPKGELDVVERPQGRPNGVALSPNGHILYVSNSDERNVRAYDLERGGKAANERILISDIDGAPDGIRTDEKGNLYVAAGEIFVYSPEGKPLGAIKIPETPSNCAFGDRDLQSLYITARTSVYRVRLNVQGALPY